MNGIRLTICVLLFSIQVWILAAVLVVHMEQVKDQCTDFDSLQDRLDDMKDTYPEDVKV